MVTRSILRPVLRPNPLPLMDDDAGFNPRSLFASGEQGIWLDPSDFSTLFQDLASTTPVTAVGQPVGLALDERLGLVLGAENITNGSFDSGTSGWAAYAAATISVVANELQVNVTGASGGFSENQTLSNVLAGKWYELSFDVRLGTYSGNLDVFVNGVLAAGGISATSTRTRKTVKFLSPITDPTIRITRATAATGTVYFDNISVRELPGNHTYQTTAPARSTAQSNYLSLDKTDDHLLVAAGGAGTTGFLLVAGIMVPAAGTARTLWSDRGTNAGYKVGINASNQIVFSAGNGAAFVTATGPALVAGTKYVITAWHDGANLNVSVNNGAPTATAFVTATAGTATFTIGKSNSAATEYWGDRIYSMIYRKNDTSNAGQRSSLYSYTVGKMGGL